MGGTGQRGLTAAVSAALEAVVPSGATACVAVSGGPDSTGLLYLTAEARPDLHLVVAHVRHGLRPDAADAEIAAAHAAALGAVFRLRSVVVDTAARGGVEAAARAARYDALAAIAREVQAGWLLIGHTADDQAETVLLNAVRGSGLRGIGGMAPVRPHGPDLVVVRPLLGLPRRRVRALCAERGLRVAVDPTNADPRRRRARARHQTLPLLAELTGHSGDVDALVRALGRLAATARQDAAALDALAGAEAVRLVRSWGPGRTVSAQHLMALPLALRSRIVRRMLADVRSGGLDGLDAESVWALLDRPPPAALHVAGGVWVTLGGGFLACVPGSGATLAARPLVAPGVTPIPELAAAVLAAPADAQTPAARAVPPGLTGPSGAAVPIEAGLVVRSRRPGDRLAGRRLSDLLAPVPRALRDLVPVVAVGQRVVWAPGVSIPPAAADVTLTLVPNLPPSG